MLISYAESTYRGCDLLVKGLCNIFFLFIFEITYDICITYCDIHLLRYSLYFFFHWLDIRFGYGHLHYLKKYDLLLWIFDLENL